MKCEHKNCTRDATSKNQQYHPDKWLCTYHANKVVNITWYNAIPKVNKPENGLITTNIIDKYLKL